MSNNTLETSSFNKQHARSWLAFRAANYVARTTCINFGTAPSSAFVNADWNGLRVEHCVQEVPVVSARSAHKGVPLPQVIAEAPCMHILLHERSAAHVSSCTAGSLLTIGFLLCPCLSSSVCTVGKDPRWCRFVMQQEEDLLQLCVKLCVTYISRHSVQLLQLSRNLQRCIQVSKASGLAEPEGALPRICDCCCTGAAYIYIYTYIYIYVYTYICILICICRET